MHKTVMSYRIRSFCSNVKLMKFVSISFKPWSCAFVGINNTSKSCPAFPNTAAGLSTAVYWYFVKALLLASELPTFSEWLSL